MAKTPFYKTGIGTYQKQTDDGALLYKDSPLTDPGDKELKLVEKGEKQYSDPTTTTTSKKVEGGTEYTDLTTKNYSANDTYAGKTYAEAGVNAEEAKEYWKNNPEEYKEYLASKNKTRTGKEESVTTRFVADPEKEVEQVPEKEAFKPYKINMSRGKLNTDKRFGLNHPQIMEFEINTPEKEANYQARMKNYEADQDKYYAPLKPDHYGTTEKALARAAEQNIQRALQRERVRASVTKTYY